MNQLYILHKLLVLQSFKSLTSADFKWPLTACHENHRRKAAQEAPQTEISILHLKKCVHGTHGFQPMTL